MFYKAKRTELKIDNTTTDCISFGSGNKNLIVIPGVGEGFAKFKGLAIPLSFMYRMFAKEYKVYIFSRRKDIPKHFTTKDMANDIIKHMEQLNIKSANIVGVSHGGMIAQYIAILSPKKVNKLVLVVTSPKSNEMLIDTVKDWIKKAENKNYKGIMIDIAERSYTGKYLEKNKKIYKLIGSLGKTPTYERFITEAQSCMTHNAYDELNKIKAPTLIIGARLDKALGIIGSIEMSKKIKNSQLYIYEEYSHGVYQQSKDFNQRILKYLKD